ncbi:kinase-like protein [Thelephora ganbajun]|uniref:Kinase-like protein n=1 Tax=Thelephora ganbajun TaxID=370292 RepID=A0ACB6ZEB1_THEGA|nr:kinase-like protein [Thelephora ganbajun]
MSKWIMRLRGVPIGGIYCVKCTPGKACSTKSKESWDSLQRVGSRSYSDPREGVQCIPSGSRNLLQKAGFWLMNCGAPSAHDNQDGISILLAEQRPHIVVDAYKAGTIHQDGESRRKTNEVLNTASLPGSYGPLRHTDDDTWSGGTPVRLANAPSRTNEWTTSPQADHGIGVPLLTADGPNKLESSELDLPLPVDPEALREHHLDLVLHLQGLFSTSCKWLEQGDIKIVGGFPVDAGGYANVWAGTMDDRKVAIKSYRCYLPLDPLPNYVRFYKEALVASRLKHQNVVPFIGAYSTPEHPLALVFDFMEHLNLKAYLGSNMNAKRLELLSDIAHGVEYIHKLNVVHGDIKTTNILVNTDGRARVAGLGAAYALLLVPGVDVDRFSKVHASAPELVYPQLFGLALARATKENDIHGFGALAYEMFGGRAPLFGSDAAGVRPKLGGRSLSRPNHPELSDRLWGVIEGCLESIPHQRKTITEVIAALDAELNPGSS